MSDSHRQQTQVKGLTLFAVNCLDAHTRPRAEQRGHVWPSLLMSMYEIMRKRDAVLARDRLVPIQESGDNLVGSPVERGDVPVAGGFPRF